MKLGVSTGNIRGLPGRSKVLKPDRFVSFVFPGQNGEWRTVQFFNQTQPHQTAAMLRQLASAIEKLWEEDMRCDALAEKAQANL